MPEDMLEISNAPLPPDNIPMTEAERTARRNAGVFAISTFIGIDLMKVGQMGAELTDSQLKTAREMGIKRAEDIRPMLDSGNVGMSLGYKGVTEMINVIMLALSIDEVRPEILAAMSTEDRLFVQRQRALITNDPSGLSNIQDKVAEIVRASEFAAPENQSKSGSYANGARLAAEHYKRAVDFFLTHWGEKDQELESPRFNLGDDINTQLANLERSASRPRFRPNPTTKTADELSKLWGED